MITSTSTVVSDCCTIKCLNAAGLTFCVPSVRPIQSSHLVSDDSYTNYRRARFYSYFSWGYLHRHVPHACAEIYLDHKLHFQCVMSELDYRVAEYCQAAQLLLQQFGVLYLF